MIAGERVRLTSDLMLAGVAFAMGTLVATVFPTSADFERTTDALPSNAYSAAYLSMVVKANPRDEHSRIALVRLLASRGDFVSALTHLRFVERTPQNATDLDDLRFDLSLQRARALPQPSPERSAAFEDVLGQLEDLVREPHPASRLIELGDIALQLERPHLAADRYELAASETLDAEARATLLARAGRWMLASGDARRAADCYVRAAESSVNAAGFRDYAVAASQALESSGDARAAADLAGRFADGAPNDAALVDRAVALELAANRPVLARRFGRILLKLRPEDPAELGKQALRELGAGDPVAALPLIREVVDRNRNDIEWREREARVAEWAGDPSLALRDWLWLAASGGKSATSNIGARLR